MKERALLRDSSLLRHSRPAGVEECVADYDSTFDVKHLYARWTECALAIIGFQGLMMELDGWHRNYHIITEQYILTVKIQLLLIGFDPVAALLMQETFIKESSSNRGGIRQCFCRVTVDGGVFINRPGATNFVSSKTVYKTKTARCTLPRTALISDRMRPDCNEDIFFE
ncbi:hypothetical protein EVAR_55_1 [Eumeta japonica]|uniref:Uncharacterized protein n=1 Tax=Eumeta variegata TaxID=151549 RepID=A0A4C1SAG0_EUMVA|nr:hypothetical protein EVAR_55_1 [Eumeta japonica]